MFIENPTGHHYILPAPNVKSAAGHGGKVFCRARGGKEASSRKFDSESFLSRLQMKNIADAVMAYKRFFVSIDCG